MNWDVIQKEVKIRAMKSRGPGGQNVNKTASAARLRWAPALSSAVSEDEKSRIFKKLGDQLTVKGELLVRSDESRDLERNKEKCLEKLKNILKQALHKPKPRKKTKPSRSALKRRKELKKQRSETKRTRKKVDF